MWRKRTATALAGTGWGAAIVEVVPGFPYYLSTPGLMVVLSVAITCTMYLALTCYQRPLGDAYELGYERGRREAILEFNRNAIGKTLPVTRDFRFGTGATQAASRPKSPT